MLTIENTESVEGKILSQTTMFGRPLAKDILGVYSTDPDANLAEMEQQGKVLHFQIGGEAAYPVFQFEIIRRRIYPALTQILSERPASWSDARLLHWLTRPHKDLGAAPADLLKEKPAEVYSTFLREAEKPQRTQ